MSRARAYDKLGRILLDDVVQCYFVIPVHRDCGSLEYKILVYVPSERVIVVDQYEIRCGGYWGRWRGMAG